MSTDYQIIEFKDSAPVTEVGIFDVSPLTLDIKGTNFAHIVEVRVNGVRSPEFIVLTPTRILAQVPRSQVNARIESVVAISATEKVTQKSVATFQAITNAGKVAEGRIKMVQLFLKILFSTPGRDIFTSLGGGLLSNTIGRATTTANLKSSSSIAISSAQSQMVQLQAREPRYSDSERLRTATLLSAEFEPQTGTLSLRMRLVAIDGSTVDAGVIV